MFVSDTGIRRLHSSDVCRGRQQRFVLRIPPRGVRQKRPLWLLFEHSLRMEPGIGRVVTQ